jgi:hypothetical protein
MHLQSLSSKGPPRFADVSPAPIISAAIPTSAQKPMTPSGYTLFLRDETLVLRALSDDANDGFFNIDRVPNTPHAIEHLRQYGMALARQAKVTFTDFTLTTPSPPTKSAPKKPRKLICLSTTCRAVRHRARKCGFTLKSRDNAYRLMVGTEIILAGTLECISAYLAVQDVPSKPMPPRILSTTYDAIAKRARRRAYIVRKTRLGYTMMRGNMVVVAGKLIDIATYLEVHT